MKKFFVVSLAVLLCLGVTLPAVAKIKVGGMITQDIYYFREDASRIRSLTRYNGGGVPTFPTPAYNPEGSYSFTQIGLPQALNRINVAYSNDDNTIRGFIEIRAGDGFGSDIQRSGFTSSGGYQTGNVDGDDSAFVWNYAWIDWVLSPKDFIRFGRQTQAFAIRAPNQFLAEANGHIVGNNFGNVHGGTSRDGIRWYHDFTDQVHFELAIYDPDNDGAEASSGFTPVVIGGATATVLESNTMPRIDVTVPLFFGPLSLWPSASYLKQKYDNLSPGSEDSVTIWGLALGAQYVWGPLSLNGEITVGQNFGAGNYVGASNAKPAGWVASPGIILINDADVTAWWFDAGWKVGPATIHGIIGNSSVKRKDDPTSGGTNLDQSSWMYGVSIPITVAKGFTVRPEFMFYDYDTGAKVGNTNEVDFGKEYALGVQFQLVF